MFAVIRTGGKQYKVTAGDVIAVERLPLEEGSHLDLDQVLMIGDGATMTVGTPLVDGAVVATTVMEQTKGDKVIVFKKKRRQNYRRKRGHRQLLTVLHIDQIVPAGAERKARVAPKPKAPKPEAKAGAKPAKAKKAARPAKKETKKAKPAAKKTAGKAKKEKK